MDISQQDLRAFLRAHPRPLLLAGIACLLLTLLAYEAPGEAPVMERTGAEAAAGRRAPASAATKIIGAEEARTATLSDPFTLHHETRQERAAGARRERGAPEQAARPAAPPAPAPRAPTAPPATPGNAAPPELTLKGIARGEEKAAAAISDGTQTHLLSPGDTIGGYTVTAIGAHEVTLTRGASARVLSLPGD